MPNKHSRGCNGNQGSKWMCPRKRQLIYARDGHCCLWCNAPFGGDVKASLDHFIPRCFGGTNLSTNVFSCCISCNSRRAHMFALEFATVMAMENPWRTHALRDRRVRLTLVRILSALQVPVEKRFQR